VCGAASAPAEGTVNVVTAEPSPQFTVTVYGPVPPETEPRLNVVDAPSFALCFAAALRASGVDAFVTEIATPEAAEAPALSVTVTVTV
jgi:hypothetical protein